MNRVEGNIKYISQSKLPERTDVGIGSQRPHSSHQQAKGAKFRTMQVRTYVTDCSSRPNHEASVKIEGEIPPGFDEIAKFYIECYQKPNTQHYNLIRLIKNLDI